MNKLPVGKGLSALVDDADLEDLSRYRWHVAVKRHGIYVQRKVWDKQQKRYHTLPLHRHLLNPPKGVDVDHIDHDGLNNQRSNLRLCTRSQNMKHLSSARSGKTSKFTGVYWNRSARKWQTQIRKGGKLAYLGLFAHEEESARAWNDAALHDDPDFRRLNTV